MHKTTNAQLAYAELCFKDEVPPHPTDSIDLALERDRVVSVLDAWAAADLERYWVSGPQNTPGKFYCSLRRSDDRDEAERRGFFSDSAEGARAAAAKAIADREVP